MNRAKMMVSLTAIVAFMSPGFSAYCEDASNPTLRLLSTVKTTRGFDPGKAVTEAQLRQMILCGTNAPSAMNRQPWFFSGIFSPKLFADIREATKGWMAKAGPGGPGAKKPGADPLLRDPLDGASAAILVSGTKDWRWSAIDCSLACEAMAIAAQSLGLGTHIVAAPVEALKGDQAESLRQRLRVPADKEPILLLLVGYPASAVSATSGASARSEGAFAILE